MAGHTAVVAGATGLVGGELIRILLEDPNYSRVVALVRKEISLTHEKLLQTVTDYERLEDDIKDFLPGARLFCCLGTTIKKAGSQEQFRKVDYGYPLQLGSLSCDYGASQFLIVTAMGASSRSSIFYNRVKGDAEDGLSQLRLRSLHIFRPSLLLGEREEVRLGEKIGSAVSGLITPLMVGGLRKYRPIQARTVAEAMLAASKQNPAEGCRIYESDQIEELARKGK